MTTLSAEAESARLATLRAYEVLDTAAEPGFDELTELASLICQTPISLVSLVDEHRQWFKSHHGLAVRETPRELAFCDHALTTPDELLIVENATQDQRFANNALVTGAPHIRFYAGAPLNTPSGDALGTLCVIDRQPRTLSETQLRQLKLLAKQAVAQLEARRTRSRLAASLSEMARVQRQLVTSQLKLQQAQASLQTNLDDKTAELEATEARYERLYHEAPDMLVSVDLKTALVVRCNDTVLRQLQYDREEIIGQPIHNLYHESAIHVCDAILHEFLKKGSVRDKEIVMRRKDGSPIDVSLNISAIRNRKGEILYSDSVARDITERKRLEADLDEHTSQLAHLSRLATANEMATGIAHEVNQPLYAIKNYAEAGLLQIDSHRFDETAARTTLQQVTSNVDRAAGIIAGLRRLIQPSERCVEKTDLNALVNRVVSLLKPELRRHVVELQFDCPNSLPLVACDQVQIEQLLVNLVLNAVEASAGVTQEAVLLKASATDNFVELHVEDRGKGIAEGELERVFEPFRTTKPSGLGVGLAICKTIAEAHAAELVLKPNLGSGVIARFRLPSQS